VAYGEVPIGRRRQAEVYLAGVEGRRQRVPFGFAELERRAARKMSAEAFAYVAGGAGAEQTVRANREAFARWTIVPRMLRDVSVRDTSVELFGRRLPAPLLTAPIGVLELAHRDADLAVARAAASEGIPMILSSQASCAMEDCAATMGDSPRWFQLYWNTSNDVVASFVARAERCGCEAIVLTLDTTMLGWRTRDLDLSYLPFMRGKGVAQYTSDSVFRQSLDELGPLPRGRVTLSALGALLQISRAHPGRLLANLRSPLPRAAVRQFMQTYSRPSLSWSDLAFLRERTSLPILLKGILHPDDARRAVDTGMDGIVVSNHGGRQLDGAIASLDALSPIVEAVGGRAPILLDSGVRTGADVFKALALGAAAVLIGRPYVYGLALAGEAGVREVIQNLRADFDLSLGLAGCTSVAEIGREALCRAT
jgi:lactate 2-monooxygenase